MSDTVHKTVIYSKSTGHVFDAKGNVLGHAPDIRDVDPAYPGANVVVME